MNYIQVIDDRGTGWVHYPVLHVKEDKAADEIVRCLVENGMMVKRQHEMIL
jgi:hypothetical protein